jgi:heavy metal translocating P-type ATPase
VARELTLNRGLLALALIGVLGGIAVWLAGDLPRAQFVWTATIVPVLAWTAWSIVRDLLVGKTGVDIIAGLSMAGALVLGEPLAGAVIALMLSGGTVLEEFADRRARRELSALLGRTPQTAHRETAAGLEDLPVDDVVPGDILLVKAGEVVPVDGRIEGTPAVLDESAMTGEARPVRRGAGEPVRSGTVNAADPFRLRATARAQESTYAAVVRLVEQAQAAKAPFVRLADRYAMIFLPVTLAIAGLSWWGSGDPVRALAVLVVATPCPLILAAPVAIVAGISAAARRGVLMKGGGALETLARARTVVFDKTGTLTTGVPKLTRIVAADGVAPEQVLRLAAALDQVSHHPIATALVEAARARGLGTLPLPSEVHEEPGAGVEGVVDGQRVALGSFAWVVARSGDGGWDAPVFAGLDGEGASTVTVAADGRPLGVLVLEDTIRPETPRTLRELHGMGIGRIVMLTGDRLDVAESIATALGVDTVLAERSPQDKVEAVQAERARAITAMVGDGINDAPALAAAHVGVAMGARGASAASEAGDVVLLVDRLDRLPEALAVARRARGIALQSVLAGMGLSVVGMIAAALGYLPPVAGALVQEAIDVAVILNALRAVELRRRPQPALSAPARILVETEHAILRTLPDRLRALADRLDDPEAPASREELIAMRAVLEDELLAHDRREDEAVYPELARLLGGQDPLGALTRAHREIAHLVRLYGKLVRDLPAAGPVRLQRRELRRVLYGLDAILRLHLAQEDELVEALGRAPESLPGPA